MRYQQNSGPRENRPPLKRRRPAPILLGFASAVLITATVTGCGGDKKTDDRATSPAIPAGTSTKSTSAPAATKPADGQAAGTVTYVVTGGPASVDYGTLDSTSSAKAPLKVSQPLGKSPYYALNAQLIDSGHVACEIDIDGKAISKAEVTGDHKFAKCQVVQDPKGSGWIDANGT